MTTIDLDAEVRRQLEERRGRWPTIAVEAGISHSWISQFVRHRIPNPGYATLCKLQDALEDKGRGGVVLLGGSEMQEEAVALADELTPAATVIGACVSERDRFLFVM